LKYGTYTDKTTGVEKNTVDIIATELQLLGGREGMGSPSEDGGSRAPARSAAPAASAPRASAPAKSGFDDMDDDIPF
jgi:single-strand DNA-binding protein